MCVCGSLPTFSVAAGLGQSLAVCQQSNPSHRDSQHAAIFTRFILREDRWGGGGGTDGWMERRLGFCSLALFFCLINKKQENVKL